MFSRSLLPALILALILSSSPGAQLKVQPVAEHPDEASLRLMLRKLASTGTFMQTTAHPDDEDNALLGMLGLGQGMRAVLVTATRGDGGQNEIGPELFQALGVLRTEELLAAHRFDGAEQYFTRAIDFGYSFSVEESLRQWGRDEILGDFVRHIRTIRPDVIVGFLCGGSGGGQHHQATAILTREAFHAAADPARYPEQIAEGLRPWQARRVFCTDMSGFSQSAQSTPPGVLEVAPAGFDSLLGRTYGELGVEARSMHKCQGTSQLLPLPGAASRRAYRLQDSVIGRPGVAPVSLFDGIDTTLGGLAEYAGARPQEGLVASLKEIADYVAVANTAVSSHGQSAAATPLAAGLAALRGLRGRLSSFTLSDQARYEIDFRLEQKQRQFNQALLLAQGLRLELLANDGLVMTGQPVRVSLLASNHGKSDVRVAGVSYAGLQGPPAPCQGTLQPGGSLTCTADLQVGNVPLSSPYWTPRKDAARYDFEAGVPFGVPFRPSPFRASVLLQIGGQDVPVERVIEYRYDNIMAGEKRMELKVVPPFAVSVSPEIAVIPEGTLRTAGARAAPVAARSRRQIEVTVVNSVEGPATASVGLQVPDGWQVEPSIAPIAFTREDESTTVRFSLVPPESARAGEYRVSARVESTAGAAKQSSEMGYDVVEYPHIHRRHVVQAASARVKIVDVTVPSDLNVGYIVGVGDQVPQAIEQLGVHLQRIEAEELASGDLSRYDVIVTGVRAYERRQDLRANNHRLLDYAAGGGTVIVQYNKFEFNEAQYGPYPAKVSSNRVTDEHAPVEVLVPDHPVFIRPNRIGSESWENWVQERGLYFLGEHDPRYVDLVGLADPFEFNAGAKTGALVEARVGQGRWVYVGLGLWRQLPAGTDGAYRLLANLLALGRSR